MNIFKWIIGLIRGTKTTAPTTDIPLLSSLGRIEQGFGPDIGQPNRNFTLFDITPGDEDEVVVAPPAPVVPKQTDKWSVTPKKIKLGEIVKVKFQSHAGNERVADVVGYRGNTVHLRRRGGPIFTRRLSVS